MATTSVSIPLTQPSANTKQVLDWFDVCESVKSGDIVSDCDSPCAVSIADDNSLEGSSDRFSSEVLSLEDQPLNKSGRMTDSGFYRNCFGRPGKYLHSEIYVKSGCIDELETLAKEVLPETCHEAPCFVVTDNIVDGFCGDKVFKGMLAAGIDCHKVIVPAVSDDGTGESSTEPHKTTEVLMDVLNKILAIGINKHSCIISVGGGVVNNICGVVAGMLYRGIQLVHFTTTTMGMLDAALDFKQAVNHHCGKNLLGCYYPAASIVIDPKVASTLSTRHVRNGVSEALKHGLTQSLELVQAIVDPIVKNGMEHLHDEKYIEEVCKLSIEIKTPTLDNYDCSDYNEMCPQYGHSIGHAIEHLSWHGEHTSILHGEAVAIGMCISAEIAHARGLCDDVAVSLHYKACSLIGLPCYVPDTMDLQDVVKQMSSDKHFVKKPSMGLCSAVGVLAPVEPSVYAHEIELDEILAALSVNIAKRNAKTQA